MTNINNERMEKQMEITVRIEAPGIMDALLAIAEQMQTHNALLAGQPAPTGPVTVSKPVETPEAEPEKETSPVEKVEAEEISLETVRALVVSSKTNKEKAKEVMTGMNIKKLTDLDQEQLLELYKALQEV